MHEKCLSMANFRSIKTLISRSQQLNKSQITSFRTFFSHYFSASSSSPTIPLAPSLNVDPFVYRRRRHFLSHPNSLYPFSAAANFCPLFLSSPPCKLSQSATSLHLQSDFLLAFPRVSALKLQFPYKLSFQSTHPLQNGTNEKQWKDSQLAVEVRDSFLNLPNLISLSRMISGPFLAW